MAGACLMWVPSYCLHRWFEFTESSYGIRSSSQSKSEVERRLLLDVVVGESAAIVELLAAKDQSLFVGMNALLGLDLLLDLMDGLGRLDLESDRHAIEGLDVDLHAS